MMTIRNSLEGNPHLWIDLAWDRYQAAQASGNGKAMAETILFQAFVSNYFGRFGRVISLLGGDVLRLDYVLDDAMNVRRLVELAWAQIYLGRYGSADEALQQARAILGGKDMPIEQARCDYVESRLRREQNDYGVAKELIGRARKGFMARGMELEAARCERAMALACLLTDPPQALAMTDQVRALFESWQFPVEVAHCDHLLSLVLEQLNRYEQALEAGQKARQVFLAYDMSFFAALSEIASGIIRWRQGEYDRALATFSRARQDFTGQESAVKVALCDVNSAAVLYSANRYDEAMRLYRDACALCEQEGMPVDAARCQKNMALIYEQWGLYEKALGAYERARNTFVAQRMEVYAALCDENSADVYARLGEYECALRLYERARRVYTSYGLHHFIARCDYLLARLHLSRGYLDKASPILEQARRFYRANNLPLRLAACDQVMGRIAGRLGRFEDALAHLEDSHRVFVAKDLAVDAALCDLDSAEVLLDADRGPTARPLFAAALPTLRLSFPDQAWRAELGLARCAVGAEAKEEALGHYLNATGYIARARAEFSTEKLSSIFYDGRAEVYDEAVGLAFEIGEPEHVLTMVERSKATVFAQGLLSRGQRLRARVKGDRHVARLLEREDVLRRQLNTLRDSLKDAYQREGPLLRGENGGPLTTLNELCRAYEEIVEQLRRAAGLRRGGVETHSLQSGEMQRLLSGVLGERWLCLDYYLSGRQLTVVTLTPDNVALWRRELTEYDYLILSQCTSPQDDLRELVYRGSIRGYPAPKPPGPAYLRHLHGLLLPPALSDVAEDLLLVIAPHGLLHRLPFHALWDGERYLAERAPVLYMPSLQTLCLLPTYPENGFPQAQVLLCGLEEFTGRARPLKYVRRELDRLHDLFGAKATVCWQEEAGREKFLALNENNDLSRYALLHFATHAWLDDYSPLQSRIMLHDEDLTTADVLDLALDAKVVTLSACRSALGEERVGDEMMSLVRAFFLAGTRSVVASLWAVEDDTGSGLMRSFYEGVIRGENLPRALRQAQLAMIREGSPPYQWAPFIALGRP